MTPAEVAKCLYEAAADADYQAHVCRLIGPSTGEEPHKEEAERYRAAAEAVGRMRGRPDEELTDRIARHIADAISVAEGAPRFTDEEWARMKKKPAPYGSVAMGREAAATLVAMLWGDGEERA